MSELGNAIRALVIIVLWLLWLAGTVLATGAWKLIALFFPFYAWYLVVERIMQLVHIV